jgi:hypothetical protein
LRPSDTATTPDFRANQAALPASLMLVRVFSDRIEVSEQLSRNHTSELIAQLRRLGVHGKITFNTPCG